ncbi:MAG: FAD binding domain-containing protein [Anaerolineales bacterium]|jgi:CO/xanthine dehydrogenase FAD-binding subunit
MKLSKYFYYTNSVEDALQALQKSQGPRKILAGGTDLLLDLQQGRHPPVATLIDITNIPEMKMLEHRAREIFIGAAVPHRVITTSSTIRLHAEALAEASGLIGGPQVRNVATLGGNIAHALPAADGTIALMALDARAEIATIDGRRLVSLANLFKGPGQSVLDPDKDLLVGFYIAEKLPGQGSAFRRIMRPQGVAIAILNCAVWVQRAGRGIEDIRISIGPSGPTPRRLVEVEDALRGKHPDEDVIESAYQVLLERVNFRTSKHRATQAYRQEMAGVLLRETLHLAWKRAEA